MNKKDKNYIEQGLIATLKDYESVDIKQVLERDSNTTQIIQEKLEGINYFKKEFQEYYDRKIIENKTVKNILERLNKLERELGEKLSGERK